MRVHDLFGQTKGKICAKTNLLQVFCIKRERRVMCRKDCLTLLQVPVTDLPLCINSQQMVQSVKYHSVEAKQTVLHIKQSAATGNKSRIA